MTLRKSTALMMVSAVAALAGCRQEAETPRETPATLAVPTADPNAPAPGSQAAEAIGGDSSDGRAVAPRP